MNLSKALAPMARLETQTVTVSDHFEITLLPLDRANRTFIKRQADFAKANQTHALITDPDGFVNDLNTPNITNDMKSYIAHVLVTGWKLKDNDGKAVKFTPKKCIELLNIEQHGAGLALAKFILTESFTPANFQAKWEDEVTKN